jgi:pimeloyl-ACP methyl ester carboxylesterase
MILVGHSYGGPMVAKLAADHPSWYVVIPQSLDPSRKPRAMAHGREISSADIWFLVALQMMNCGG